MAVSMHWKLLAAAAALAGLTLSACGGDDEPSGGDKNKNDASTNGTGMDGGGNNPIDSVAPIAKLEDGVAGKPCMASNECTGTGATCSSALFGGAGTCTGRCEKDENCGSGGTCVKATIAGFTIGTCAKACSSASECDSTQECREGVDVRGAANALDAGSALGDASVDNVSTCQPKPKTVTLGPGIVGKACTEGSTTCGEGTCSVTGLTGDPLPGGYCTGACNDDSQCGSTGGCVGAIRILGITGYCLQKCTADTECRTPDYACASILPARGDAGVGSGTKYCIPPTAPRDGGTGTADAATGAADAGVADAQ